MIVITADQVASRSTPDLAESALESLGATYGEHFALPADRMAGDEIQMLVSSGEAALGILLTLTRTRRWSVGLGVGAVREPLAGTIREATGDAFIAARFAVERAKRRTTRFALNSEPTTTLAADTEALIDLVLTIRARRSEQGWEVHDLVSTGLTQADAAVELGITPQSASKRARAAELRVEDAATAPLVRLLERLDRTVAPPPEEIE